MIRIIKLGDLIYENIEPYYLDENGKQIWQIPNDVNKLKQAFIDTVKWQANMKLKETDWVVVKCMELNLDPATEYPDEVAQRRAIRNWCNQKEKEFYY